MATTLCTFHANNLFVATALGRPSPATCRAKRSSSLDSSSMIRILLAGPADHCLA